MADGVLDVWTIYDHPLDYPSYFVVRRFTVTAGQTVVGEAQLADSLDEARALVPPGLYPLGRSEGGDPTVIETWI